MVAGLLLAAVPALRLPPVAGAGPGRGRP